jgi:hypothetical protein
MDGGEALLGTHHQSETRLVGALVMFMFVAMLAWGVMNGCTSCGYENHSPPVDDDALCPRICACACACACACICIWSIYGAYGCMGIIICGYGDWKKGAGGCWTGKEMEADGWNIPPTTGGLARGLVGGKKGCGITGGS